MKCKGFVIGSVMVMLLVLCSSIQKAEGANKNIKVEDFIKYIVKEMKWEIDKTSKQPYIDAAIKKGILKKSDFKDYSSYLTRTDCAVIANRLDEMVHLKYGYPKDVYEFLSGCIVNKNKLFYDTEGSLYPKGKTRATYPEERFHKDVVMPILGEYFKDDIWSDDKELWTGYFFINDKDGNITKSYLEVGVIDVEAETLYIDSFPTDSKIIKAWKTIRDSIRKEKMVLEKRISDINDIPKSKRETVASIVAKSIIKGFSNGMYVQSREFRGKNNITVSSAKEVIQRVLNPELRAKISPDGQLIRTTNLPRNADKYDYILECFPNEFYERQFEFMLYDKYKDPNYNDDYAYPVDMKNRTFKNWYDEWPLIEEMDKYLYDWQALAERYLNYLFNVDYRTVDDDWIQGLASVFTRSNLDMPDMIRKYYIKSIKNNKVIVESDIIAVEPSTFYMDLYYCMRVYVRYKITAVDLNVDHGELIYSAYYPRLNNLKSGEWREGIFDVRFGINNGSSGNGADFRIDLKTEFIDDYNVPYK